MLQSDKLFDSLRIEFAIVSVEIVRGFGLGVNKLEPHQEHEMAQDMANLNCLWKDILRLIPDAHHELH
jgi:hypothetical protein